MQRSGSQSRSHLTYLGEILFTIESFNWEIKMPCVPQGAFAAIKIRENEKFKQEFKKTTENRYFDGNYKMDLSPPKYSGKYMNSVWGMYNRYSVHNLKKNYANLNVFFGNQQ